MKTRIFIGILLLITVIVWYFYLKDHFAAVTIFQARYFDIATIVITAIIITYIISKIIDIVFIKAIPKLFRNDSLGKKIVPLIHNITLIIIWIFAILTTVDILGFNINTLLTWAWISWVILALAGKEAASNLFWSLSLIFSRSFKIGDLIRIKWLEWNVEEITLSYTRLTDKKGNIVYMPNKNIITDSIENLSQWKHRKHEITLPLPINLPASEVQKFLETLEKYSQEKKKKSVFDDFKIMFDSFTKDSQIIIYNVQVGIKQDQIAMKRQIYLDLKDILDKQKILFPGV
jgi:MscS family membrane protein